MTTGAADIVRAGVEAAIAKLKSEGFPSDPVSVHRLFMKALEEKLDAVIAELVTPSGNAGPLKEKIAESLEKALGKKVLLEEKADPSLLGGAIVRYGDVRLDMSVQGALSTLAL
jgi:F-type H+-transporting ATPase subunit delta